MHNDTENTHCATILSSFYFLKEIYIQTQDVPLLPPPPKKKTKKKTTYICLLQSYIYPKRIMPRINAQCKIYTKLIKLILHEHQNKESNYM